MFSDSLNKYYIGATSLDIQIRISQHNSAFFGNHHFTAKAQDWSLFWKCHVNDFDHAIRIERKIKAMKSRIFIQNLKKYPELTQKIISQTKK